MTMPQAAGKNDIFECDFARGNSFWDFTFKRTQKLLLVSFAGVLNGVLVKKGIKGVVV